MISRLCFFFAFFVFFVLLSKFIFTLERMQEGLRPVVYYMEHLLQDTDEEQMLGSVSMVLLLRCLFEGSRVLWEFIVVHFSF